MRILRSVAISLTLGLIATPLAAQAGPTMPDWELPRTVHGYPDLQGNWTNATITPIQRPGGVGAVLTAEQVAEIEGERQQHIDESAQPSDPDRDAPTAGGQLSGDILWDGATGGTGGYNYFYIDAGDRVAVYDGQPRSSLVTMPENGRIPPMTAEAMQRRRAAAAANPWGEYDNPENRPLADRCIKSFGSNLGPPMLPNYFYNNNYTIVQNADHVLILTEMVHDVRIIPLGEASDSELRPWFGNSWARYEGNTLVIETTHLPAEQIVPGYVYPGGSEQMRVTERLTRVDEHTINYEFTVDDPGTYSGVWGGQVPFKRLDAQVYEYACHEGNYAMENILRGARSQEAQEGRRDR